MSANNTTGLIVPVDIVAFCVGEIDATQATSGFAGATTVYTDQTTTPTNNQAFLGSNVSIDFSDPPWDQLEQGVHLHWALPDALTRASTETGQLDFPAVPNRWLLTRFVLQGNAAPQTKSWVIISDALSATLESGQHSVTLPVTPTSSTDAGFRYVGSWQELEDWAPQSSAIKAMTGSELSAVASGDISFAAYYPNCRSVFGFYDSLSDITVTGNNPAQLMYTVTGWFDNAGNDPLSGGVGLADLQKKFNWTFPGDGDETPSYTVYSGIVQDIAWNPSTTYIYEQSSQLPIQAEAALGNNPAEALSAYFTEKNQPGVTLFEQLLTAFQMGLFNSFKQPTPNVLEQLYESLHEQQFRTNDGGTMYTIVKDDGTDGDDEQEEMIDLPPQLADDLNQLNLYQQQYDLCQASMGAYRWQLFADWYRIFMANAGSDTQNDAFHVAYYRYAGWSNLSNACVAIQTELSAQLAVVTAQVAEGLKLKAIAAPRYYQPGEPVLLLNAEELQFPSRYGGDDQFNADGYLLCRLDTQTITALTANGESVTAAQFSAVALPAQSPLPHPDVLSALLEEACLLNTQILSAISGLSDASLQTALQSLLDGQSQSALAITTGYAPSPLALNWWNNNPWLPIYVYWTAEYLPLQPTMQGETANDYAAEFFTANYSINQDEGGSITYSPGSGEYSIKIDPSTAAFNQQYTGQSLLSPSAAEHFANQLSTYLENNTDATLQAILEQLQESNILVQSLSGFNNSLLMRAQTLQLNVSVPANSEYAELTGYVSPVVGDANQTGPQFNGYFNPIRAGYMKLQLQAVDAYGQKRVVQIPDVICTTSMISYDQHQQPVPSVAYLEPRLAQPLRLLFRWLSADATGFEEMNAHPATSPVCGWLLPNHLDGSFFLYNQQGQSLGSLYLNGDQTAVEWQSAPGNDKTINQSVETVLQHENPQLLALAVSLANGSADFFKALWLAVDTVHSSTNPQNLSASSGLAVLIGRPVALVQASLRLEVEGSPALNLGWYSFDNDTDSGLTGVQFPAILGDVDQLDDGLIGYFKQNNDGTAYDLSTFYTEGVGSQSQSGVVQPDATNLLLTVTPKIDSSQPPDTTAYTQKVLMLIDPRASVHATSGIVPTKSLDIPSDMIDDALSTLEMSFLVTPVLNGSGGLALPIPKEQGYQFSWVEEDNVAGVVEWSVNPEIQSSSGAAVWAYTPQQITEGWLRMNPVLLEFALLNSSGHAVVTAGTANSLTLDITNRKQHSITFDAGQLVSEGQIGTGSIFYIHFGDLVSQTDIPNIQFSASGWTFQNFSSAKYGQYWAATPTGGVEIANNASVSIDVQNLVVSASATQAQVYFDYYNINGLNDGVYAELLAVQSGGN